MTDSNVFKRKHSVVYVKGDRAVKRFHPHLKQNFWKEVKFLEILQPYGFVPRIYRIDPENLEIEMAFIKGEFIIDFLRKRDAVSIRRVLIECFEICYIRFRCYRIARLAEFPDNLHTVLVPRIALTHHYQ